MPINPDKLRFSRSVEEALGYYVYGLRDPRCENPNSFFYIGKGIGQRVYSHVLDAIENNKQSNKLDTLRDILNRGDLPEVTIFRFGLDEDDAFLVESVLISLFGPNLVNEVSGHLHNKNLWTPRELETEFGSSPANITFDCILIKVNRLFESYCKANQTRSLPEDRLYQITRTSWKLGKRREKYQKVLSVAFGIIREIYDVQEWKVATIGANGEDMTGLGKYCFDGRPANDPASRSLIGKTVDHLMSQGAQNPIMYFDAAV